MPDPVRRPSPSSCRSVILEQIDPLRRRARFYALGVEPCLLGGHTLVREWGRLGRVGQRRIELYATSQEAEDQLRLWLTRKLLRGYVPRRR